MALKIYAGVMTVGLIILCVWFFAPPLLQSESSDATGIMDNIATSYKEAVVTPLEDAGAEIQDENIAAFYGKLMDGYDLDNSTIDATFTDEASLANLLPDIKKIHTTAMTLPFKEAGKEIQDADIAAFYSEFTKRCGLNK